MGLLINDLRQAAGSTSRMFRIRERVAIGQLFQQRGRRHEEKRAGDGGAEVQQAVVVAGRE